MSINLIAIAEQTKAVACARESLAKARVDYAKVKALCRHDGYEISIAGVRIDVAKMDSRTYMAKLIHGRDMLHLGSLKVLDSLIDHAESRLRTEESKLTQLAAGAAP